MEPDKLILFSKGYSKSKGGLNIPEVRNFLVYHDKKDFSILSRKELQEEVKKYLKKEIKTPVIENNLKIENNVDSTDSKTILINVKVKNLRKLGYSNFTEWNDNVNHVYIGRHNHYVSAPSSKWKNPFSVKKYGREGCIEKYRNWIKTQDSLLADLDQLRGKVLGCWCYPDACHGDVLLELLS